MNPTVTKLKSAVIGTGKISEEHLRFLSSCPLVSLEGVCDLSPSLAQYATRRFGAKHWFTDHQKMLAEVKPDVVHILTPATSHVKLATDCLNAGTHVIVEKPIAMNRAEFAQLWELAQSKHRVLIEDHNYRYNEPIQQIQSLVQSGRLGEIREVEVRMNLAIRAEGGRYMDRSLPNPAHQYPCGVIHEFITHLCYLTLAFMPDKIDTIKCAWRKHGTDDVFKYDDLDALVIAGPVHGRIRYASDTAPDCFIVSVHGDKGSVSTDLFLPHLRLNVARAGGKQLSPLVNHWCNGWELIRSSMGNFRNKVMQKSPYEGLQTFMHMAYTAIAQGTPLPVTFNDMDQTILLIDSLLDEANRI